MPGGAIGCTGLYGGGLARGPGFAVGGVADGGLGGEAGGWFGGAGGTAVVGGVKTFGFEGGAGVPVCATVVPGP